MKKENIFALFGDIIYSKNPKTLSVHKDSYIISDGCKVVGVYPTLPEKYNGIEVKNHRGKLIIPAMYDLHTHAPQYTFCATGMDMELVEWLKTHTFAEEEKYCDIAYATRAYSDFVSALKSGATARACIFATVHSEATLCLMKMLEDSGLVTMVGRVNMDRNCPDTLSDVSPNEAYSNTRAWICESLSKFKNTSPILTPRFIPSCSDELMRAIARLQSEFSLPVQSHLSENKKEIEWVKELSPESSCYGDAYRRFGLFGGNVPTVMAHCVHPTDIEFDMMQSLGVTVAHCPSSNANLSSGIAPVSRYIDAKIPIGLGTDVGAGQDLSVMRAVSDAVQMSKIRHFFTEGNERRITLDEAFYLATKGGGSFFGNCGSFDEGYDLDALVIDDSALVTARNFTLSERLERAIYLEKNIIIEEKYVCGKQIF